MDVQFVVYVFVTLFVSVAICMNSILTILHSYIHHSIGSQEEDRHKEEACYQEEGSSQEEDH